MIKPFWKKEDEYLEEYVDFLYDCEHAYNLKDALACGANMTKLDGEEVGWLEESGGFALYEPYKGMTDEELEKIEVSFDEDEKDYDGYTIAKFRRVKE